MVKRLSPCIEKISLQVAFIYGVSTQLYVSNTLVSSKTQNMFTTEVVFNLRTQTYGGEKHLSLSPQTKICLTGVV